MTLQPENQATEEAPRPPNNSLVTDEKKFFAADINAVPSGDDPAASQTPDDPASPENKTPKPKGLRSAERKIGRLKRQLESYQQREGETKAALESMRAEIEELKTAAATPPAPAKPAPDIKDFNSPEEYAQAYGRWQVESQPKPPKPTPKPKAEPRQTQPDAPVATDAELQDFRQRGQKAVGDEFLDAIEDTSLPISKAMGEYLLDADQGPELYTYLANNPETALALYHKNPATVSRRLDKLAKQIEKHGHWDLDETAPPPSDSQDDTAGDTDPPPRRSSKAPKPPPASDRGNVVPERDMEKASMDDYAATRRKQILSSGRKLF